MHSGHSPARVRELPSLSARCIPMSSMNPRWVGRTCPQSAAFDEGMRNGAVRTHAPYLSQQHRDTRLSVRPPVPQLCNFCPQIPYRRNETMYYGSSNQPPNS